eukprot:TRINITY_DN9216_c0_g1_i1.p1 TRINITY_DN9216_c0_g1~~TRINITY_DN9216_c0_g1_i1.p1  ORF type:complete len:216 (-),score=46.10 TRINITY_DN9216_c0_g1_i1:25-633(-)
MMDEHDHVFKILLVGDAGVGKTSLLLRFIDDSYTEAFISTVGSEYLTKNITYEGMSIQLQIWDTAGAERFRTITSSYYRAAHGIILVYDVTNEKTFQSMRHWLNEAQRYAYESVSKILVGNKCDEPKVVNEATVKEFADSATLPFIETSAKTAQNVEEAFRMLLEEIGKLQFAKVQNTPVSTVSEKSEERKKYAKDKKCIVS